MKLLGSKTESQFREELQRSNEALQNPDSKLRKVLERGGHNIQSAYVLHYIPEQLEDLYTVLVSCSYLLEIEIDKYDDSIPPIVKRRELKSYLIGLSKVNQIRLATAYDLASTKT